MRFYPDIWPIFSSALTSGADRSLWAYAGGEWRLLVVASNPAPLAPPEWTSYPASDGVRLPAAVWRGPAGSPWVVWVRGGPRAAPDRDAPELAALADAGFSVLQPDYRGCGGRGRAWAEANRGDYGGRDADDVVDAGRFLAGAGWAAPSAVGVVGYSYGGFLVLTALARAPEAFGAGALLWPLLALANLPALAGTDFVPDAWEAFSEERSSLRRLEQISAPLLLLWGDRDRAATPAQVRAVRAGVAGAVVEVFAGDGHGLARNTPTVCRRLVGFFRFHLSEARPIGGACPPPCDPSG